MIPKETSITYAQYREDIVLRALFHDEKNGFYVDVGANFPETDSVTKYFYDAGWRGVNIEPISKLHKMLLKDRPKDINLSQGISGKRGKATLREYINTPGHSTLSENQKQIHEKGRYRDYEIELVTLGDVIQKNKIKKIHFLKIDVEGYEYDVLEGMNWQIRPEVICIEANQIGRDWRPILQEHNYKLFICDGLNNYYVSDESWGRTDGYAERAVRIDYHALKKHHYDQWFADTREIRNLRKYASELEAENRSQRQKLDKVEPQLRLTLSGVSLPRRIKRSLYGLTADWLRYKHRLLKNKH